jgi:NAD(P)-dependent dehydrogenase (short-subunit alcohol dehydrogenase family)
MSTIEKVAVVTGASRVIGAATVKAYREMGYGIVAVSRSEDLDFVDSGLLHGGNLLRRVLG